MLYVVDPTLRNICVVDLIVGINKSSSAELSEAINSMFRWYQNAAKCYVYLSDIVTTESWENDVMFELHKNLAIHNSRWFTRGWTLQELIAPTSVEFFSADGYRLGDKASLTQTISQVTGIAMEVLKGSPLSSFGVDERMEWAAMRNTKREEDAAYCLLGIFDIHMPLLYGEGREKAFNRLRREIRESSGSAYATLSQPQSTGEPERRYSHGFHLDKVHLLPSFTPRERYLKALEYLLPSAPGRKIFILYGLGGIGKTQLALNFATHHQSEFTSIFFLDGSSKGSLLKSFALIYRQITEGKRPQAAQEKMAVEVVHWLMQPENNRWLLILDNIDKDPSDDDGFDISSYFPSRDHGSILVTTRLAPLSKLGRSIKVGRMSEEEASSLLVMSLGESLDYPHMTWDQESPAMLTLLQTLDGLPLAISQAGRLMNTLNIKFETYMELYISSKRELMDMLFNDEERSIRTTWTTSLNLLKHKASQEPNDDFHAAYHLLRLFAYFEPSDLNYDILRFGVIGNDVPTWFRRTMSSKIKFFSTIKILLDLCLIDNNVSEGSYSMHRVVHDWLCTYVCGETDRGLLRIAAGAISFSAPLIMTQEWFYEQQRLALHAISILPRLNDLTPHDFLVRYDEMSKEELDTAALLLKEPVKCWKLMKFDYTLIGIARLLQSCKGTRQALKMVLEVQSKCPETLEDGTVNPIFSLLRQEEISCRNYSHHILPGLAETFYGLGSPSWAIKSLNLYALMLEGLNKNTEAVEVWYRILDQSRNHTGSIFVHPTWMVFNNLAYRLIGDATRELELFLKFETEAEREKDQLRQASAFLEEIKSMRADLAVDASRQRNAGLTLGPFRIDARVRD